MAEPGAPMVREVLADVALPEALAVAHVETRRIRMQPGTVAGAHVHNGPVVGCIEEGWVAFQIDGGPERRLVPGDVFYEPPGGIILHFDAGDLGVTFVAHYLLPKGQVPEIAAP